MKSTVLGGNGVLIVAVIAAQLADLATFLIGVTRVGVHAEQNALIRHLYASVGPLGPALVKVAFLGLVVYAMERMGMRFQGRGAGSAALIAVAFGLLGVVANVSATLYA